MRIAVCDDEMLFCEKIKRVITEIGMPNKVDAFCSGEALLSSMNENEYDIVFLDVEMSGIDGLELSEKLKALNPDIIIIFASAFNNYVIDAFRLKAFQFINKGADFEKNVKSEYLRAVEEYKRKNSEYEIFKKGGKERYCIKDIVYLESKDRHLYLFLNNGLSVEFRGKLDEEAEKLSTYDFVRIHKSYLVNLNYVKSISGGVLKLDVPGFTELQISRAYRENSLSSYNLYKQGL